MKNPVINVLTRTSNRPDFFKRCVGSIKNQTYKNVRHLVSADNQESYDYANTLVDDVFLVEKRKDIKRYGNNYKPYNFYINDLLDHVEDGFVLILDDDDILSGATALEKILPHLQEDMLSVWLVDNEGRITPHKGAMQAPVLIPTEITASSFAFHSKHKWAARWDAVRGADYRAAQRLSWLLGYSWINEVIVKIPKAHGGETNV